MAKHLQNELLSHAEAISNIGIWEFDINSNDFYWSDGVFIICGYEPQEFEVTFEKNLSVIHPDDREFTITQIQNAIAIGKGFDVRKRFITKQGVLKHINSKCNLIKDNNGNATKLRGVFQDITQIVDLENTLKKTNDELLRTNDTLKTAQKITKMGNWEYNLATDELFWSDELYQIFEIDKEDNKILNFNDFSQLIHPDDFLKVIEAKNSTVSNGQPLSVQHRIITKNKQEKIVREVAEKVFNKETNSFWLYGTIRDATDAVLNQIKIEESEKKYKYLFESNPSAMFLYDFNTLQITDCNNEALELYGYTKNEFLKLSVRDIRPKEDVELLNKITASEETYGQVNKNIWRHKKKNGEIIFVDATGHLIDFKSKRSSLVQVIDVTEKLKADEAIKASEQQRELIMNAALDAIICINKKGDITFWNPQAERIFGWKDNEVMGKNLDQLIFPDYRDALEVGIKHYLKTKEGLLFNKLLEISALNKAGKEFPVELTVVPIQLGDDEFFCSFIKDISQRKKVEKEILESNQRYNYVTKATYDAIWDWNLLTDEHYLGEGFKKIFGYEFSKNEVDSHAWLNNIHPEDYERVTKGRDLVFKSETLEENWTDEYRFLKADGNYAYVQDKGIIIRNNDGVAIRMVGAMQDITKKKEENLRLQLLESVITNTNDAVLITEAEPFDEPGPKILYVNEAFTKMTGYTLEDVIGKTPRILQGPKSDKEELKKLSKALRNWESCEITTINYKKNGEEFYINFTVNPVADKTGFFTHWIAIERDVTESVITQQKLMTSFDEKNTILESIDDGFFATDKNSIITYWNKKAEILLNATKKDVLGKNLLEMFADPNSLAFHHQYQLAIKENKTVHFEEYSVLNKKWFEVSAFASDKGLSVYFKDITDKKQVELKLLELNQILLKQTNELSISNKELEQFAYVASHDLQEPLRMVTSFLTQIENKYSEIIDEKGKQYIYYAVDGAKRMRQIILDLLEFSRIGKLSENLEEVDLNAIVQEIQTLYRRQIDAVSASIEFVNFPKILSYKTPIRQLLQNLIGNALKYHSKNIPTIIKIEVTEEDRFWQFSVKDNGIGITEEYYEKIFIIFQRLHNKDEYSGTGMGLAICKKIVENLGGKIWVEAVEGKGSNFYFTILKK